MLRANKATGEKQAIERNKVSMMLHFIYYNITWKDCVEQGFTYIGYKMSNHHNTNIISILIFSCVCANGNYLCAQLITQ